MNEGELPPSAGGTAPSGNREIPAPTGPGVVASRSRFALALGFLGGLGVAVVLVLALGIVGNPWYRLVKIDGGSMSPTITQRDLVLVVPPPAQVRPGMVVVMNVGDQVVTHRVVAVNADGTLVTKGDANRVADDWGDQPVRVVGRYLATIPLLGAVLPVPNVSAATFMQRVSMTMSIAVGAFPGEAVAATVRVVPQTISLKAKGDVLAFVDSLADPHTLAEIDLSSIQLCYGGQCMPSDGSGKLDGNGHVAVSFDRASFASLVGSDRCDLLFTVQGTLADGDTLRGTHTNRVTDPGSGDQSAGSGNCSVDGLGSSDTPGPTPTSNTAPTPTPSESPSPTPSLDPTATSGPDPTDIALPTESPGNAANSASGPSPDSTSSATPSPNGSPTAEPTAAPAPTESPTSTDSPAADATPIPSQSPGPTPSSNAQPTPVPASSAPDSPSPSGTPAR